MPTTWDAATAVAVTLSSGNLVATNTGTTSSDQGAHVAAAFGKTTGKWYYEATFTALTGGGNYGAGVGTPTSTYPGMGFSGGVDGCMLFRSGNIYRQGVNQTGAALGARSAGNVIGVAVDLDNRTFWFRVAPAGLWNASGTANPATNTGGLVLTAGTMVPFVTFGGNLGTAANVLTANFGALAFTGALPSGFVAWEAASVVPADTVRVMVIA